MTQTVTLLLGVHAHQPVGNFPEVIEDAHQRCYKPFIETLYAYPDFRFAAHFSGWLLDWLRERHPADMALLAEMVARGQVELFSSGDTEPVLAAIPAPRPGRPVAHVERQTGRVDRRHTDRRLAHRARLGIVRGAGAGRNRHRLRDRRRLPFLLYRQIRRRTRRLLQHRGGWHPARPLPDLRSPALPPALLAGARGHRLPGKPGRRGPRRRHLFRRHREVRHLAGNLRLGLQPRLAEGADRGRAGQPEDPHRNLRRLSRAAHDARHRLPADHLVQRDERMDAADAGGAASTRTSSPAKKLPGASTCTGPSCAAASGATSSRATRKPTGCTSACRRCRRASPRCLRRRPN